MKKILVLLTIIPLFLLGITPRVLVLTEDSFFDPLFISMQIKGELVLGSDHQIKQEIINKDKSQEDHIFILDKLDDIETFKKVIGYATIYLKDYNTLEDVISKINDIPITSNDLKKTSDKSISDLYLLLAKVDGIFKNNDLFYWGSYGTLLGTIRHEGIIPWDDDIDLGIFYDDIDKLKSLSFELEKQGLELFYFPRANIYKIFPKNGEVIICEKTNVYTGKYPFIDIIPMRKVNNKIFYRYPMRDTPLNNNYFLEKDLKMPLEIRKFGSLLIPIPHNSKDILNRFYGEDWAEVAYCDYDHKNEQKIEKVKVKLIQN